MKLKPTVRLNGLTQVTLSDFWFWAYSDVLSNRNRSIFAKFIVTVALGCLDRPRMEWDACDLSKKLKYWDYKKVLEIHEALEMVNESINSLGLVPQGF